MKKTIFAAMAVALSFIAGMKFNNDNFLYEANEFKREYIEYLDGAAMILDSIMESHTDDGVIDQLVNELNETEYYQLIEKRDSMARTQL